jgi:hypothetical protein
MSTRDIKFALAVLTYLSQNEVQSPPRENPPKKVAPTHGATHGNGSDLTLSLSDVSPLIRPCHYFLPISCPLKNVHDLSSGIVLNSVTVPGESLETG